MAHLHIDSMNLSDTSRFFLVYPLHLEDLGLLELQEKCKLFLGEASFVIIAQIPGGIEIECPLWAGLLLNRILRTPTRILLRLTEFKCRDFPKLFQKISKFPWSPWMIGQVPEVEVASKNSRLFDSRKIEKAIQDGVAKYYIHQPVKKKYLEYFAKNKNIAFPKIYFRSVDDICTLSLDTTGDRLHLRGEKTYTGLAPIRENLAALLLLELRTHLNETEVTLIDPMCGSGTFLIEAKKTYDITLNRDFSFLHLPIVMDSRGELPTLGPITQTTFPRRVGLEINSEIVELAKKNDPNINFYQEDLFSKAKHNYSNPVVIINPPYGIRVGENINLSYYLNVIENIKRKFSPNLMGIIIPDTFKLKSCATFSILNARSFKNGGIEVTFYVLKFLN